jgi:type IX secretion system PorP/SprF family membrane protein
MKTKRSFATVFLLAAVQALSFAQDIHFSQYNFSPLTLNPALTAAYKDVQATLNYKQQWHTVNAYTTYQATCELKLDQKHWVKLQNMTETYKKKLVKGLAFGINIFSDNAGDGNFRTTQGNLSVAYHSLLNEKNTLSAGLMGGIVQRSIDPSGLRWNSQYPGGMYDPAAPSGENFTTQSFLFANYSAGLLWSYGEGNSYLSANDHKFFNAGISVFNLNRPQISFTDNNDRLYRKWVFHGSAVIGIKNTHFSVAPSLLFMQQGPLQEVTAGVLLKYKLKEESVYTGIIKSSMISIGCFYRNKDAVIPYLLLEMDKYSMGISYDTNVSGLTSATSGRGGFEISLRFGNPSPFIYQNAKSRI